MELLSGLVWCTQAVSRAAYGLDQRLGMATIDLLPQPADMYVDHVGLRVEAVVHASSSSIVRVITCPAWRIKISRSLNSRG